MKSKVVYLLRHGHSEFQAQVELGASDLEIVDAELSAFGRQQVNRLNSQLPHDFELVVTSPLARCIDTSQGVMGNQPQASLIVNPLLRERLSDWCDIGRPASELRRKYPNLDFGELHEQWWYDGPKDDRGIPVESWSSLSERVDSVKQWIAARQESSMLLVSHSDFLARFTGLRLPNCEPYKWDGDQGPQI